MDVIAWLLEGDPAIRWQNGSARSSFGTTINVLDGLLEFGALRVLDWWDQRTSVAT